MFEKKELTLYFDVFSSIVKCFVTVLSQVHALLTTPQVECKI